MFKFESQSETLRGKVIDKLPKLAIETLNCRNTMTKANTEKIVYTVSIIFVIVVLLFSIPRSFEVGDKATIIYLAWSLMFIYFLVLSILFFKSQLNNSNKSRFWFNIISIVPGVYLVPGFIMQIIYYNFGDILSNIYIIGSIIWLLVTAFNLLNKEKLNKIPQEYDRNTLNSK